MKSKLKGVLGVALTLLLLLSLFAFAIPTATASSDVNEWSKFSYPDEGSEGDWFYDPDIDYVGPIAMAINGDLYCAAYDGSDYHLFKSDDNGRAWSKTDYYKDLSDDYPAGRIVDIACSSEDADIVYVADDSYVYWTEDGGDTFDPVAAESWDALSVTDPITALDVGYIDGEPYVFVSTGEGDYTGSVYFIEQMSYLAGWTDMDTQAYGAYDVYAINVAPDFGDSHKIFAVITQVTQTQVIANTGTEGAWSQFGGDLETATTDGTGLRINAASDVCFPDNFDNDELYVGVSGVGTDGSVYRLVKDIAHSYRLGDAIYDTDISLDVVSLDITGDVGATLLMAGAQDTTDVFYSTDDGESWDGAGKAPSGSGPTYVLMASDFADSDTAWAATSGDEGAISYTIDGGDLWNQISLISTDIAIINCVSFYPNYESSEELFMATSDGEVRGDTSLWRYDGEYWERVAEEGVLGDDIDLVQVSPDIADTATLYIAETSTPTLYRSTNEGQSWKKLRCQPDSGGNYTAFGGWMVIDDETVIVGGENDSGVGYTYKTTNHGNRVWDDEKVDADAGFIVSFARSGDELLCGDDGTGAESESRVFISDDLGDSWDMVGEELVDADGNAVAGDTYVAFDSDYADNSYVYAAAEDAICRFEVGESSDWADIENDAGLTTASGIVTADGCVYVSDSADGAGMWRSVNPTDSSPLFEAVDEDFGLDGSENLYWLQTTGSHTLWALDNDDPTALWTYEDGLVGPVEGGTAGTIKTDRFTLSWTGIDDADDYDLKVYSDEDFKTAYKLFSGLTGDDDPIKVLTADDGVESGTEYWCKVRVGAPLVSKWSDVWSLTTLMGEAQWNPFKGPVNEYPYPGASDVPLNPTFAWNAADWATGYEFVLADNDAFADPMVEKTLATTVYAYDGELGYSTTYYWKVRAVSDTGTSNWATGVFTTIAEPVPPTTPPPPVTIPPVQEITPGWIYAIIGVGAVLVIAVIILIVTTRRVP